MTEEKFPLGRVVMTPGVAALASEEELQQFVRRHHAGDWGVVDKEDRDDNDDAVGQGGPVHSAYECKGTKIWVITEGDRSVTTVLLPDEY